MVQIITKDDIEVYKFEDNEVLTYCPITDYLILPNGSRAADIKSTDATVKFYTNQTVEENDWIGGRFNKTATTRGLNEQYREQKERLGVTNPRFTDGKTIYERDNNLEIKSLFGKNRR